MRLKNRKLKDSIFDLINSLILKFIKEISDKNNYDYFISKEKSWISNLSQSKSFELLILVKGVCRATQSLRKILIESNIEPSNDTVNNALLLIEKSKDLRSTFKMIKNNMTSIKSILELNSQFAELNHMNQVS